MAFCRHLSFQFRLMVACSWVAVLKLQGNGREQAASDAAE